MKPHSFNYMLLKKYPVCTRCGLIALKNERTRKAMNKACPGKDENDR